MEISGSIVQKYFTNSLIITPKFPVKIWIYSKYKRIREQLKSGNLGAFIRPFVFLLCWSWDKTTKRKQTRKQNKTKQQQKNKTQTHNQPKEKKGQKPQLNKNPTNVQFSCSKLDLGKSMYLHLVQNTILKLWPRSQS